MSIEANKAIVQRIHDELNRGNRGIVDELYDPGYVSHVSGRSGDLAGYKTYLATHRAAFPDWHTTLEALFGEGDLVVARVRKRGTHAGAWQHRSMGHLAPTHRVVESTRIIIRRLSQGRVVESWVNADHLGMLHQVGAIRMPDGAS